MTIFADGKGEQPGGRDASRRRKVLVVASTVILLAALFLIWRGCRGSAGEGEPDVTVAVQVATAERGSIAEEITSVATLAARREATVSPKVAAPIAQMDLLKNRFVHEGDVIAVLESRDLAAQRAEAQAGVQEANASAAETTAGAVPLTEAQDRKSLTDAGAAVENAKKTFDRRQALYDQGGISKKELEASKLALTNAEDDLRLAEAAASLHRGVTNPGDVRVAEAKSREAHERLANLDAQLSYVTIRAPFDGTITDQFQYRGEMANPGSKLVTIADLSTLVAKMQLSESVASHLRNGGVARVMPDDLPGTLIGGTIDLVGQTADPQSRSVEVWVTVPNPSSRLRANGLAQVVVEGQPVANAVIVPSSAVTLDATNGNTGTVMVVDAKSIAHEVHVTVGIRSNGQTQITTGLRGGERVVTEGNYGLPDGTKVSVEPPATPGAPEQ